MTDDSHHSLPPVVNAITGFCIAFAVIVVPLMAISRVKSTYNPSHPDIILGRIEPVTNLN